MMNILVCDDHAPRRDQWLHDIQRALPKGAGTVVALAEPKEAFHQLFERQNAKRNNEPFAEQPCPFDDKDVLVIDYDLVMVDATAARHNGEELARLCRLFSQVGYIIVMNQFNRDADYDFDLRMERHPSSYADLNISSRTIRQAGLWDPIINGCFRPWHWDDIAKVGTSRRSLAEQLAATKLEGSIADALVIPNEVIEVMPDRTFEFLNRQSVSPDDFRRTTFASFLKQQVEGKEFAGLVEWNAVRAANWAVSRLAKWLSRMVLGPQDLLIDIPHLIERLPFLMDPAFGSYEDEGAWARLPSAGLEAVVEPLRSTAFSASLDWLGKVALWWPLVEKHEFVREHRSTADLTKVPDLVFAEDRSQFVRSEGAVQFGNDDANRFRARWVTPPRDGLIYEPKRRLFEF